MLNKKLVISLFIVLLIAGSGTGWYLFRQSSKLSHLSQVQTRDPGHEVRHKVNSDAPPGLKATSGANRTQEEAGNASREGGNQTLPSEQETSWVNELFLTPSLVQDAAGFLISRYHPPESVRNPNSEGMIQLSFKSLNTRYGLDYLSSQMPDNSINRARRQVLKYVLHPRRLKASYDSFVPALLDSWQNQAMDTVKTFSVTGGAVVQRHLSPAQVAEMFDLYAVYFEDIGQLLGVLTRSDPMPALMQDYLQAEKEVARANYALTRAKTRWQRYVDNLESQSQDEQSQRLQEAKKTAAARYRQALRSREEVKARILQIVHKQLPKLGLDRHEILYMAQWVHRRYQEGEKISVLAQVSNLVLDFSKRLAQLSQRLA